MHTMHAVVREQRTISGIFINIHQSLSTLFCLDKVSRDGHREMAPWLRVLIGLP